MHDNTLRPYREVREGAEREAWHRTLVCEIGSGNRAVEHHLWELVESLRPTLQRRSPEAVDDILQETFMETLGALRANQLRDSSKVFWYASRVAQRKGYRCVEEAVFARTRTVAEDYPIPDPAPDPEQQAIRRQQLDIADSRVAALKPRDREIVTRFYMNEETKEEICSALDLTADQFRNRKSMALGEIAAEDARPAVQFRETVTSLAGELAAERKPRARAVVRDISSARPRKASAHAAGDLSQLTPRETQIFRLFLAGLPQKLMADSLNLSVKTVNSYMDGVRKKAGSPHSVALILLAVRTGWIDLHGNPPLESAA